MFAKTLKQLWEEFVIKAESIGTDMESPEIKLLGALVERCNLIEVDLGLVQENSEQPVELNTATELVTNIGDPENHSSDETKKEPVWDGKQHV